MNFDEAEELFQLLSNLPDGIRFEFEKNRFSLLKRDEQFKLHFVTYQEWRKEVGVPFIQTIKDGILRFIYKTEGEFVNVVGGAAYIINKRWWNKENKHIPAEMSHEQWMSSLNDKR